MKVAMDKDAKGNYRWFQSSTKTQIVHPRYNESFNFLVREGTPSP